MIQKLAVLDACKDTVHRLVLVGQVGEFADVLHKLEGLAILYTYASPSNSFKLAYFQNIEFVKILLTKWHIPFTIDCHWSGRPVLTCGKRPYGRKGWGGGGECLEKTEGSITKKQ